MDSSMVESVFDISDDSDAYSPEPKATKAKPAAKAAPKAKAPPKPKAAPKKMTQTTLKSKATAPKKRTKAQSDEENVDHDMGSTADDSLLSNTPPSAKRQKTAPAPKQSSGNPLQPIDNESFGLDGTSDPKPKSKSKGGTSTDQYQKLTQLEHILKRPDTYIGSVERTEAKMWVYNSQTDAMELRDVSYVPGLYKIFDEILVNAADNKQRDKNMDELKVTIDAEKGEISVWNNGRGIPIEVHEKEKIYIPEMIFGHLLTSSNYDDEEQKVTGGRNGYGAKLCNVYSTQFCLETVDSKTKQKYAQTWNDNMSKMHKAKITANSTGKDYTKITFWPDFKKFGMDKMDDDFEALVKRRVYDMAGTCKDVKVSLNGEKIKVKDFKKYMEMYTKAIKTENLPGEGPSKEDSQVILTDKPHPRWEIGFAVSDGSFQQVSFVNSIATTSGGTHVNYIADQIVDKLAEIVKKKNKGGVALKPAQIRSHIFLFVNCLITNPAFTSQTKEQLTTKPSQFGSKCVVSEKFLKDIAKTEAVNNIIHFAQQKADQILKKSDGNKRTRMNHSKLTDANRAGTKDGHRCTLILTEGDSASLLALAGRAVVDPDLIGVFPLRGKLLNVRDASFDQISKNQEITNIKKFMGLQHKKVYEDTKSLRYGHLMIMTDQDHDGSHIKGLLINLLEVQFPSLLKLPGFLQEFITPIVKVWKGDPKNPKKLQSFFTMPEYEAWREMPGNNRGWDHKYFKGLGTSSPSDAEVYFRDLDKHLKEFDTLRKNEQIDEPALIDLAFSKKKADARKEWLRQFRPGTFLDMTTPKITYDDFINKELILFSMADNLRSIPSVVDGFKPTQRKVLYTCFRRNLKKDVKVVELAGSVSGLTAYSYGDVSLQGTIVGLAQNFVGSNNINCLEPSGNFGSRLQGGHDCASARYIYTRLSPFARKIFHATDEPLLTYNTDDGKTIEPEAYIPILPMILVNGADGIGTGWSTSIPNYNPVDIIDNLKLRMDGTSQDDMKPMKPWFRGWTNEVEPVGPDRYKFSGTIRQTGDKEIEITELPVRMWTQEFKDWLEEIVKAEKTPSFIKDYTEYNTPVKIHFVIKMEEKHMADALKKGLEEAFKLSKTMATSNLVAFDSQGRIKKYTTELEIMEEFYHVRLKFYSKRKEFLLNEMQMELDKLNNQARFVRMIVDGKLVVSKKKKAMLVSELRDKDFKPIPKVESMQKQGEFEPVVENDDEEETGENQTTGLNDYDYLLGMAIWSLTEERIEKLTKQIGSKEDELTKLINTSEKQLWKNDLDDFLNEWRFQLEDEERRARKLASQGRRASAKLRIGGKPGAKKRKADQSDDDSDFAAAKTKATKPKASNALKRLMDGTSDAPPPKPITNPMSKPVTKPRTGLLGSVEQSPSSKPPAEQMGLVRGDTIGEIIEGDSVQPISAYQPKKPAPETSRAPKAPKKIVDEDDEDDDVFMEVAKQAKAKDTATAEANGKPAARQGRAASRKPVKYTNSDESEHSESDDNFDVGNMVKGIGGASATTTATAKPLFSNSAASASRPSSSHSITKPRPSKVSPLLEEDETDYKSLVPRDSPMKSAARNARDAVGTDDDDDILEIGTARPPLKTTSKPSLGKLARPAEKAVKPQPAAAAAASQETKPSVLSPAAKAYAAKQAKAKAAIEAGGPPPAQPKLTAAKKAPLAMAKKMQKKKPADSDDDMDDVDDLANDLLKDSDDGDDAGIPAARPSRRAASRQPAGKPKYVLDDDDDEDEDEDEESEADFDDDDSD